MDIENQAGTKGLKLAASKGLAVVIMEPLLGGRLATPPNDIRAEMEAFKVQRTPVDWALQWLWDQPEVSVVLSGMSTMQQVEENLGSAGKACIGSFGKEELAVIASSAREVPGADGGAVHQVRLLHALPGGSEHSRQLRHLQLRASVREPAGRASALPDLLPRAAAGKPLRGLRGVRGSVPAEIPISEWMPKVAALLA